MTLETVAGNHVILDVGDGRYAFYGHLMPGTEAEAAALLDRYLIAGGQSKGRSADLRRLVV